jgi:hypothetical protein
MRARSSSATRRAGRGGRVLAALSVAAAFAAGGCASSKVAVRVDCDPAANGGAPFYVVVRAVEQGTFVTESYEAVASKVFATPTDPALLKAEVVHPGAAIEVVVEKPKDTGIGVYFLYTKPGERWKTGRVVPLPDAIDISLGANQIESED